MTHSSRYFAEADEATRVMAPLIASVKSPSATLPPVDVTLSDDATLTPGNVTLPGGETLNLGRARSRQKSKGVFHVRLQRKERAGLVVLSSAEKYNLAKAAVEPLLEHLAGLSSADFYGQLHHWRETIAAGLDATPNFHRTTEDTTDSDTGHSDASIDPVEFMGSIERHPERDDESDAEEVRAERILVDEDQDYSSRVSLFDLDASTESQGVIAPPLAPTGASRDDSPVVEEWAANRACDSTSVGNAVPSTHATDNTQALPVVRRVSAPTTNLSADDEGDVNAMSTNPQRSGVEVLTMPAPKKSARTRQKRGGRRTAIVDVREAAAVRLVDAIAWAFRTADIAYVYSVLDRYPVRFE